MLATRRQRKSIRLKEYDYSTPGGYFVTICAHNHENMFGEINDETIRLSPAGIIAERGWNDIPNHFANVQLDEYIIMPNHIHGIIILLESTVGVENFQPLQNA